MTTTFHPRLINDPFLDPGLFINFLFQRRAILFDLGDLSNLAARDILKTSHIFVTHTHMDHFIGFDTFLRLALGRQKEIRVYGPSGFMEKVESKLGAYTWNLIDNYENTLTFIVTEIKDGTAFTQTYKSTDRFKASGSFEETAFTGNLVREGSFSVDAVMLDHKIDCMGFCLTEDFSVNIIKEGLEKLDLPVGPWLREFKMAIHEGRDPAGEFRVDWQDSKGGRHQRSFCLGELSENIARITPGQKITYIVDMVGSEENIKKAIRLAKGSTRLFIEAGFLQEDAELARRKYHLTAAEAGLIGARAGVKEITPFHFSPRYCGRKEDIIEEVLSAFGSQG